MTWKTKNQSFWQFFPLKTNILTNLFTKIKILTNSCDLKMEKNWPENQHLQKIDFFFDKTRRKKFALVMRKDDLSLRVNSTVGLFLPNASCDITLIWWSNALESIVPARNHSSLALFWTFGSHSCSVLNLSPIVVKCYGWVTIRFTFW